MSIPINNFKVSIGSQEIPIKDRFTLIKGKIKKNLLNEYKNDIYLEISENFNIIPIEKFIGFLQEESKEFHDLLKSKKILNLIHEYRKKISNNIMISSQFNEILQDLITILRFNLLLKEKEFLLNELELSEKFKKSSDITAITDLLKKLNESLSINKKKLQFLEEDFFQQKNQVDQLRTAINEYDSRIQELTKQKKECFSQINRITREMTGDTLEPSSESYNNFTDSGVKITNAEKIRNFQKKAKEIQFKINKYKSKRSQTQLILGEKTPIFEIYEKDYQALLEMINTEEKRLIELKSELKNKIRDEENTFTHSIDLNDFKSIRPLQEIKHALEQIDTELNKIIIPEEYNNPQNPSDFSLIVKKLKNLDENIKNNESEIVINIKKKEIYNIFEQFRKLEKYIHGIESILNKFLLAININSQPRIIINDNNQNFFIEIKFIRTDNEKVDFDGLTTPEKIFFMITFYLSIKLQIKEEYIIFSNLSILSKYNKAGSIYRTIRKILPIFEMDKSLSRFNLVFIISNLELKREIKNLKINTLQES
ncbi:MAG: coiled-coil domain-containing protein [Candidatus Hodarchaeota archaeon]